MKTELNIWKAPMMNQAEASPQAVWIILEQYGEDSIVIVAVESTKERAENYIASYVRWSPMLDVWAERWNVDAKT